VQRFAEQRGRNAIATNFNGLGTIREGFLYSVQVAKDLAAVFRGLPRSVWDYPMDLTQQTIPESGADEISDRSGLARGNPPHIVMRIHMNQDALRTPGITPNQQRFVVVLNAENSAQRSIQRFAFRGSQKQLVHFNSGTCLTNREDELHGCTILHLDQAFGEKFLEEAKQVASAPFRLDVIFVGDRGLNLSDRARLLHQVPDSRSNRIETVVDAVLDVQDRGFPGQVAGYLVLRRYDDGTIGNC
jgi:hypothetical protein